MKKMFYPLKISLFLGFFILFMGLGHRVSSGQDRETEVPPKVLLVTAHPDDDALFAVTVYKISKLMDGKVDLALLTNGEGGYKYSTLGEDIYGLDLTDEKTGREYLPAIRKQELMAGGRIMGIRNYFFLEQVDNEYTNDAKWILEEVWDTDRAMNDLRRILRSESYDYVFTMLPSPATHGHHKSASILALRAVAELPEERRPTILAATIFRRAEEERSFIFEGLDGFPETRMMAGKTPFHVDRTRSFGHNKRLNFKIISGWVIAEHKSQGTMQLYINSGDVEEYWFYAQNSPERYEPAKTLFQKIDLAVPEE